MVCADFYCFVLLQRFRTKRFWRSFWPLMGMLGNLGGHWSRTFNCRFELILGDGKEKSRDEKEEFDDEI